MALPVCVIYFCGIFTSQASAGFGGTASQLGRKYVCDFPAITKAHPHGFAVFVKSSKPQDVQPFVVVPTPVNGLSHGITSRVTSQNVVWQSGVSSAFSVANLARQPQYTTKEII
jgi:hypothetical protein